MRLPGVHSAGHGRLLRAALFGAATVALGCAGFALAGRTTLSMTSAGPDPDTVTIPWGETVVITNEDTVAHQFVSSHAELQTPSILPQQTYTTTFTTKTRAFTYRQVGGKAGYPGQVVIDFSGRVSLRASAAAIDLGRPVRLSGTTSLHTTPVALEVRRAGDGGWSPLTTVFSDGRGAFSATLRLTRGGKIRATVAAGQIRSVSALVGVRPKLTAARTGGRIRARLAPAGAAKELSLQCRVGPGRWKRVASKRPGSTGTVTFTLPRHLGLAARVAVAHRDVVSGYAPQASRTLSAAC